MQFVAVNKSGFDMDSKYWVESHNNFTPEHHFRI
jgi:hypothetical protein